MLNGYTVSIMITFQENDYRLILKERIKKTAGGGAPLTLKKIAARISIQYTYLSKALNQEGTHLSEDHLHEICKMLNFYPDELEYVLALRGLAVATSQSRKNYLTKRMLALRSGQQSHGSRMEKNPHISGEVNFLLAPQVWLVYFALGIKDYRENPRKLAANLGIEMAQLKTVLQNLSDLALIEIGENVFAVKKVNKNHFYYNVEHPLTRIHQQLLRLTCDAQIARLPETQKQRFMVTFNAELDTVEKIRKLFATFIKDVEGLVVAAPSKNTFQLNFELFQWF